MAKKSTIEKNERRKQMTAKQAAKRKALPKKARFNVAPYATPTGGGAAARFVF